MEKSDMKKKMRLRYGLAIVVGGAAVALYMYTHDFAQLDRMNQYLVLCDAFTLPGFLMICFGLLIIASNAGALDGLFYGLKHAVHMLIPGMSGRKDETFYDYLQKRKEKRVKGYSFLFITGVVFMAIAMVFLVLFYRMYGWHH